MYRLRTTKLARIGVTGSRRRSRGRRACLMDLALTTIRRSDRNSGEESHHGAVAIHTTDQTRVSRTTSLASRRSWTRWSTMMNLGDRYRGGGPVTSGVCGSLGLTVRIRIMFSTRPADSLPDRESDTCRPSSQGASRSPATTEIQDLSPFGALPWAAARLRAFRDAGTDGRITSAPSIHNATFSCDH